MHKVSMAAFVLLSFAVIATLVAAFSPGWISGTYRNLKVSGGLSKIYIDDQEVTYEALQKRIDIELTGTEVVWKAIKANVDGGMAFIVIALLTLVGGIVCTAVGFNKKKKRLLNVAAHVITLAGTFTVIAISFGTGAMGYYAVRKEFAFGYSYWFAWFAMIFDVIGGALVALASHFDPVLDIVGSRREI